jgi:hypothetical protein
VNPGSGAAAAAGVNGNGLYGTGSKGVLGQSGTGVGVQGESSVYIGVLGSAHGAQPGIAGQNDGSGPGVLGFAGSGIGVQGTSLNVGVYGTGQQYGIQGQSTAGIAGAGFSVSGDGLYGSSTTGRGVYGISIVGSGVVGQAYGTTALPSGVVGLCDADPNQSGGKCNGVLGVSRDAIAEAVVGDHYGTAGGNGVRGTAWSNQGPVNGVVGESKSPQGVGVIGVNSSGGLAIVAQGNASINGSLNVTGNIINSSSRRFKHNIEPIHGALRTVEQLRGVTFNWNDSGRPDIGLVAEEVAEVVPQVAGYEPNGLDVRGVDYARLTAILIEAIKEQQSELNRLRFLVETLRAR